MVATDGALWVIFDNTPLIARIEPDLEPGRPGNQVLRPPGSVDYEDIAHDHVDGRYFVLVEAVRAHGDVYKAQVHEFARDFTPLAHPLAGLPVALAQQGHGGADLRAPQRPRTPARAVRGQLRT